MIGFAMGTGLGIAQFILLRRFTRAVTEGGNLPIWMPVVKIFLMMAVLGAVALLVPQDLVWAGVGTALPLLAGAVGQALLGKGKASKERRGALE